MSLSRLDINDAYLASEVMGKTAYFTSLRKALTVLKCFTPKRMELSGAEIARMVGMHRTTAYRILSVFENEGLVERLNRTGKYTVGPSLYALGSIYLEATEVTGAAAPVLSRLNELTTEVVSMVIRDNRNVILIAKEESRHLTRFPHHVGTIFPAYSTPTGRMLLSELSEEEIDRLFPEEKFEPVIVKTISSKTQLKQELNRIRTAGATVDRNGPIDGLEAVAAIVRNSAGKAVAAISFAVPASQMVSPKREQLTSLIALAASLVSYRLGYQDGRNPVRDIREIISWWEQTRQDLSVRVRAISAQPAGETPR